MINDRFDKIEESIDLLIAQKLAENSKVTQVEQIEAKIDRVITHNESYTSSFKDNNTDKHLASIIKETKNENLIQKREREKRSANLIIYGIGEVEGNNLKDHDKQFIDSFLDTIGVASRPNQIVRLGKPNEDKRRPVKLVMRNEEEKDGIMSRLSNLKNAEDIYKRLSVRDDYTIEERETIRDG